MAVPINMEAGFSTQGRIYERRGDLAKALEYYRAFVEMQPHRTEAWLDLAEAELNAGEPEAAERAVAKAEILDKGHFRVMWVRGMVEQRLGRPDRAAAALGKAIPVADRALVEILETRARAYTDLGQAGAALADSIRCIILRHGFIWCSNLGRTLSGMCRESLGLQSSFLTALETSFTREIHNRSGTHFRERGFLFEHPGELRLGFISTFEKDQVEFLARLLPALKTKIPGLKIYAYGTRALADTGPPAGLGPPVVWKGFAGTLTWQGGRAVAADELDVLCDLDWGYADARTDIVMTNPAPVRWLWMVKEGRSRITICDGFSINQDSNNPEWPQLVRAAEAGAEAWRQKTDCDAAYDAAAERVADLLASAVKEIPNRQMHPLHMAGDAPPPLAIIDEKRKKKPAPNIEQRQINILTKWVEDVRRLNFNFGIGERAAGLRIAVLTPYTADQTGGLEFSRRSLLGQNGKREYRQFLIGHGAQTPAHPDWDAEHILIPHALDDLGLAALSAGAKVALAQGYNAIAFLPPGVRWRANHLDELVMASSRHGSDLTMGRGALVGTRGKVFAEHVNLGNIPVHHDAVLSTFLVTRRALSLMPLWAAIPRPARYYATGIFRSAVRTRHLRQFMTPNATIEAPARDLFSFHRFSNFTPDGPVFLHGFKERALMQPGGEWPEWLALLTATNTEKPFAEPSFGALFDAIGYLGVKADAKTRTSLAWLAGEQESRAAAGRLLSRHVAGASPVDSLPPPLWPCEERELEKAVDEILAAHARHDHLALRIAAHHKNGGPIITANGAIYSLAAFAASLAERGWFVQEWEVLAQSPDREIADYVLCLKRQNERKTQKRILAA